MERMPFPVTKPSYKTWEPVFKNPGSIALKSFVTAVSPLKKQGVLNLNHPKAAAIKNDSLPQKAPVLAHWIRHKKFGDYLIDAGLDSSYQKRPYGRYKGILVRIFMSKTVQEKGGDIRSRIDENQVDLKGIFFTHLHFDHIGGAIDIPKGLPIRYAAGKGETHITVNKKFLFRSPDFLEGVDTLYEIDFNHNHAVDMPLLGKCVDIFGDGSLWAISTPGHTPGHMAFLVNSDSGPVLLTGDACLMKAGFELGIGPGIYSKNIEEAQKSLDKLTAFAEKYPAVKVVFGHQLE